MRLRSLTWLPGLSVTLGVSGLFPTGETHSLPAWLPLWLCMGGGALFLIFFSFLADDATNAD